MRATSSGAMPTPSSVTRSTRLPSSRVDESSIAPAPSRCRTASAALLSRLTRIWRKRPGSVESSTASGSSLRSTLTSARRSSPCTKPTASSTTRRTSTFDFSGATRRVESR
jgi:hypothetical protein